ncbi:nucleotide-binding universal stress UspA family protein [Desulfosoma caldarium]|uniref:Nucleotide-binding universal stress UspA family protein n=2 Tax=Desulfosoma caldarium TaxID=610254 RepID=A0A3N1UT09_9BACT|nr:nucleotide-binding universal stress UspA family protein [Desulfosoma caldarium]
MSVQGREGSKIVVGYDGTRTAKEAVNVALFHARHFHAEVHVVWSLEGGHGTTAEQVDEARDGLQYVENLFREAQIPCQTHLLIRGLSAGEDLVRFAEEQKCLEIIVGVRRRSQVGKLIFGSTARYVILNASCPVVSVR